MFDEENLLVVVVTLGGSQVQPLKIIIKLLPWCLPLVTCCTGCKVEWRGSHSHLWGGSDLHLVCLKCWWDVGGGHYLYRTSVSKISLHSTMMIVGTIVWHVWGWHDVRWHDTHFDPRKGNALDMMSATIDSIFWHKWNQMIYDLRLQNILVT